MYTRHVDYVVEPWGAEWTVSMRGERAGRFPSRLAALRSAVGDAQRVGRMGFDVAVWMRHSNWASRRLPDRFVNSGEIHWTSLPRIQ
ncbi:hypothetical protein [Consotaella aegiceratis]|uniref:hypothetical protein n=1 Tax=Consotaella aegiceratis TaxID=3097961 RepID=UPI002F3E3CD2